MNFIKKWIGKIVEDRVSELENKIFEPKQQKSLAESLMWYIWDWQPFSLEKEIDILQERQDALEKHLKVRTEKFEKEEGYHVVKIK